MDTSVTDTVLISDRPFFPELVSYRVREVVVTINLVFFGEVIGLLGIAGNIINMIVFSKHGFYDTVNISLLALSLADLGSLISMQWFAICANPWFLTADLPFLPIEIQSLTAGFPHVYFIRVTGFVTAFISFERCLCVIVPLKVKRIITKKFAITYNVFIFLMMVLSVFPAYYTGYYDWKWDSYCNKSKLGIFYTANKDVVMEVSLMITNFGVPIFSFLIIVVSTTVTGLTLQHKAKWRKSASRATAISVDGVSNKEKKVVIMITMVSIIFIISLLPLTIILAARAIEPELSITGKYANINWLVISIAFLMEIINSSINILIFYRMSTKYRNTIHDMFSISKS